MLRTIKHNTPITQKVIVNQLEKIKLDIIITLSYDACASTSTIFILNLPITKSIETQKKQNPCASTRINFYHISF